MPRTRRFLTVAEFMGVRRPSRQWQGKPSRWRASCTHSWTSVPLSTEVAPCSAPTKYSRTSIRMPKKTAHGAIALSGSLAGTTGVVVVGWATVCAMAGPPREFASHLGGALDDGYGSDSREVQRAGASRSQWRDRAGFPPASVLPSSISHRPYRVSGAGPRPRHLA